MEESVSPYTSEKIYDPDRILKVEQAEEKRADVAETTLVLW